MSIGWGEGLLSLAYTSYRPGVSMAWHMALWYLVCVGMNMWVYKGMRVIRLEDMNI